MSGQPMQWRIEEKREPIEVGCFVFGDWEVTRELGEGAYGCVYEIQKNTYGIGKRCALKVISIPKGADERRRLAAEMDEMSVTQYLASVVDSAVGELAALMELSENPNIMRCEDFDIVQYLEDDSWDIFMRLELLESLPALLKRKGPLAPAEVVRMGEEICGALASCERKHVIHRDVKPENIFVSETGVYKLGDFGMARTVSESSMAASMKGTELYMAPEILRGEKYGATVDTYALGLVLYRMLNDNLMPFYPKGKMSVGIREQAFTSRMTGAPMPAPGQADEALSAIILKACAYKPEDRYPSAEEMRQALAAYRSGGKTDGPVPSAGGKEAQYRELLRRFMSAKEPEALLSLARDWELLNWLDSAEMAEICREKAAAAQPIEPEPPCALSAGDIVRFGRYRQNAAGGEAPIEWQVLKADARGALLISRYGLDTKPYHRTLENVTWETSTVRAWLNGEFLNTAFTEQERGWILPENLDNRSGHGAGTFNTTGGNNTRDSVFLLSRAEAEEAFATDKERICMPTDYTVAQGAFQSGRNNACWWWLRSPGAIQNSASLVSPTGGCRSSGVDGMNVAIRPAFRVSLDAFLDGNPAGSAPESVPAPESVGFSEEKETPLSVGDIVTLGNWGGRIGWRVLKAARGEALLVSQYGLEVKPYHQERANVTWEKSSLRAWLNSVFLDSAFTEEEKSAILLTRLDNSQEQGCVEYGTAGGKDTEDRVFLLSFAESRSLFASDADRVTGPTAYAAKQGQGRITMDIPCPWWLRSPGRYQDHAICVLTDGTHLGRYADNGTIAVRPALRVNPDSAVFKPVKESAFGSVRQGTGTSAPGSLRGAAEKVSREEKKPLAIGALVRFGRFRQDADPYHCEAPIEWQVLKIEGDRAMLISRYGLDARPYHMVYGDVTWETSTLRAWLNGDFLNTAFNREEQAAILITEIDNSKSQGKRQFRTDGGNDTQDRVFLLSFAEAWEIFSSDRERICCPTKRAVARGAAVGGGCRWWLRSPGLHQIDALRVNADGTVGVNHACSGHTAVRPAIWVNLGIGFF